MSWLANGRKSQKRKKHRLPFENRCFRSGANRDRTDDLLNAIQALSQLSYGPEFAVAPSSAATGGLLAMAGGAVKQFWRQNDLPVVNLSRPLGGFDRQGTLRGEAQKTAVENLSIEQNL